MSKKMILAVVGVLILVGGLIMASCAAPAPAPAPTPAPAPAPALKVITWTYQSSFSPSDPIHIVQEKVLDQIRTAAGGRLVIKSFPGGAIVPAAQEADALRTGTLDLAYLSDLYNKHLDPALPLLGQMAGGLSTVQLKYWFTGYGGYELAEAAYAPFDIVYVGRVLESPEDFAYTAKGMELKTLADVKKLKMRTAGIGGEIMTKMGASTVFLPGGELYESMQRGVINSFEYGGAASFWDMKFQEVTANLYLSFSRAPADGEALLASKKAWSALPDDLRAIVLLVQRGAIDSLWQEELVANAVAMQKIKDYGIKVEKLPKEIEDAFIDTANKYFDAEVAKYGPNSFFAKMVKSMREFKKLAEAQGVY